jgi:hypothetical protein
MKHFIYILLCATFAFAQDSTVDWKVAIGQLERQLPAASDTWKADAEALRASLATFAADHPNDKIDVPAALPESASGDALSKQLDALRTAVDEVIKVSPGTPFNLGVVSVTVSGSGSETSPVTAGIDQQEMRNLDLLNVAKALDELPGVSVQHICESQ